MIRTAALSISAGIVILHYLPLLPPSGLILIGPIALASLFFVKRRSLKVILLFVIGFTWAHFQATSLLKHRVPETFVGKDITVIGHITSIPKKDDRKIKFEFDIEAVLHPNPASGSGLDIAPTRVRLAWYQRRGKTLPEQLSVGDKWTLTVRLKPPRNFINPGAFNYSGWLLQKKILSTGYIRNNPTAKQMESDLFSYPVQRLRQTIRGKLMAADIDTHVEPFLRALVIGDRSDMKTDDWVVLKDTGTVHLMAISGLHIGLVAGLVFFLTRIVWSAIPFLTLRFAAPRAAAIMAWFSACIYAALAGFSLPTQRALIMLSIILLTIVLKKTVRPSVTLSLAVVLVLILDSFAVLSVSFWLSFGAVALIYYFINIQITGQPKLKRWLVLQLVISLGLLPLTIQFFQQAPIISPVANLIAVPIVGFVIVPLAFVGTVALLIDQELGTVILSLTSQVFEYVWNVLEWLSDLPISTITFSTPGLPVLLLGCAGFLLLLLPGVFRVRSLAAICCVPLFFPYHDNPAQGEANVTVLDVGQGLATVIQTQHHALVFDTGPQFSKRFDTGRAVVLPFLNEKGIRKLDVLLVSHADNDHVGGAKSILSAIPVSSVITSVPDKLSVFESVAPIAPVEPATPTRCQRGQQWTWDGVKFEILHPAASDYEAALSENNLSCVLSVTTNNQTFLFTGDIEVDAESLLLERYGESLASQFLVAPHHGSKTSSSQAFISAVKPNTIIIPVGWRNRYRFPHQSVLDTYARQKSRVLSTAEQGAITIKTESAEVRSFSDQSRHYWDHH